MLCSISLSSPSFPLLLPYSGFIFFFFPLTPSCEEMLLISTTRFSGRGPLCSDAACCLFIYFFCNLPLLAVLAILSEHDVHRLKSWPVIALQLGRTGPALV